MWLTYKAFLKSSDFLVSWNFLYAQVSKLVYSIAVIVQKKNKPIKLQDTTVDFFRQNGNILVSEELNEVKNVNKHGFMARDRMHPVKGI